MIFNLVADYANVLAAMPREHPRYRILKLLDEAIRRDVHFIDRHPTTVFQCMWNSSRWYDCPEAAGHYDLSERPKSEVLPWESDGWPVSTLLEHWHASKERATPGFAWLRSLRPPLVSVGTSQKMVLQGHGQKVYCVCYSPDGSRIASGSGDETVRIWDAASGNEIAKSVHYLSKISSVCFSPDSRRLAIGCDDSLNVLDATSCESLFWIQAEVNRLCYSPDGKWLATTSS